MTTLNHRYSRRKIQHSGGSLILVRSLTRPASTTSVTSVHRVSSPMASITRATSGSVCVHHHASPFSGFATRLSGIQRFSPWPTTTPATGFQADRSGHIHHIPSLASSRSIFWSRSIRCPRISTFLIPRFRGLWCSLTRTTARDGFVVRLVSRHERPQATRNEPFIFNRLRG